MDKVINRMDFNQPAIQKIETENRVIDCFEIPLSLKHFLCDWIDDATDRFRTQPEHTF